MVISRRRREGVALAVIAALAVTGCGSETPEENEAEACAQLAEVEASVQQLSALDIETASVDDYRAELDDIATNLSAARDEIADVAEDRVAAIEAAFEGLRGTLSGVDDQTLPEIQDTVNAALDQVQTEIAGATDDLDCS